MNSPSTSCGRQGGTKLLLGLLFSLLGVLPASAHRIEKRFTVDGRPLVTVRNSHGRITVRSWQKAEILVVGDHASNLVEVAAEQLGNRVEVTTHATRENLSPAELRTDYDISVPEETELQVRTDSGTVHIEKVSGEMTIDTVAADVELRQVWGYMVVRTIGGSLVCTMCSGRLEFNSISGNVRLIQSLHSSVRANTMRGSIFFEGRFLPGGTYSLTNYDGSIEVRFSESESVAVSARTINGRVDSNVDLKPPVRYRTSLNPQHASSLFGMQREGHAKVELTSINGTIRIRKRD